MRLDQELRCFGLLGFGSGHAWGKANIRPDEKLDGRDGYCAKGCPEAARCLAAHRSKVQIMFPKAAKAFDALMEKVPQAHAMLLWRKAHPQTPIEPYAMQMIANSEDGLSVAQTGAVKPRGRLTLKYPPSGGAQ